MTDRHYSLPAERLETKLGDKKPLYTESEAVAEANRCIYCSDAPCIQACPTGIDIPTFIHKIATKNVKGAARTILESNLLGYTCARVCPVEVLCVGDCVYNHWGRPPIQIGRLQRYATEVSIAKDPEILSKTRKPTTGKKIACIGAGPASIAAAGHLALDGHSVVIYEAKPIPGGLNTLGIAPYKLQADDALAEIEFVQKLGDVEVKTGIKVVAGAAKKDRQVSAKQLVEDYDAVFLGIGLGPDNFLDIEGADGPGVVGATAFIERIKADPTLSLDDVRSAAVIGGGNTAIDVARELALLGVPEVTMVYRRSAADMSGYVHEMDGARREGVRLIENRKPVEVVRADGRIDGVRLQPTDDGRPIEGAVVEYLQCDLVAMAIGQARLTTLALAFDGVELDEKGRVVVDEETCRTGHQKVYAGGDCVNGGKEVVNAAQHGKLAARHITATLAG